MVASDRSLRHFALLVLPAVVAWLLVSRSQIGMSPDSLFYWSAARTMHDRGTVATGVSPRDYARTVGDPRVPPDVGETWPDGSVTYPLTMWPPGYPAAIAALMPLAGGSAIGAARLLAVLTLVLLIGAFAATAAELTDPRRAAFAAAVLACLPFVQTTVRMMWSDALFAALALAALALLARAFDPARPPARRLMLAALAMALATYVRYTGVLVAVTGVVAGGLLVLRSRAPRGILPKAALAIVLYGALVAPLFARNFSLAGDLSGAERSAASESAWWVVRGLVQAFVRGVVPWVGAAVPGPRDALVTSGVSLGAWAIAAAGLATAMRRGRTEPAPAATRERRPMALILVVFTVLYSVALFRLRMAWHFDFNTRMLLPAVASLALLLVCAWQRRISDGRLQRVNVIALVLIPLVTVASLAAADHYVPWRGYNHPAFLDRPLARWARNTWTSAGPGAPVRFLSVGYFIPYLHFATGGAPVAALPDVPEPATLVARPPVTATIVLLEAGSGGRRFRCPAYQAAYEQVLDGAADSTVGSDDFTAWWLSAAAAAKLEQGARRFGPSCH